MNKKGYNNSNKASIELLLQSIKNKRYLQQPSKRDVTLLLDTDREIGKETGTPEARVGFTPVQADLIISELSKLNISSTVFVVKGAGALAGFSDNDYELAGCKLLDKSTLTLLQSPPDVVHALKEPSDHEGVIAGRFIRIGALHLKTPLHTGIVSLLNAKNFSSILDGAVIGSCSYLKLHGHKTPIVASMSVFAGKIAADKIIDSYSGEQVINKRKVVIVGGGVAGLAAAESLIGKCGEVYILELDDNRISELRCHPLITQSTSTRFSIEINNKTNLDRTLTNAIGIILAQRSGGKMARSIISIDKTDLMAPGAVIVDIAIDQGGSIENLKIQPQDNSAERIRKNTSALSQRGKIYFAEENMPRAFPKKASIAHGSAVLPYLIELLVLCAIHGGPEETTNFLLGRQVRYFENRDELPQNYWEDYFQMVVQDLRNGTALATRGGTLEISNPDYSNDSDLAKAIRDTWISSS